MERETEALVLLKLDERGGEEEDGLEADSTEEPIVSEAIRQSFIRGLRIFVIGRG